MAALKDGRLLLVLLLLPVLLSGHVLAKVNVGQNELRVRDLSEAHWQEMPVT